MSVGDFLKGAASAVIPDSMEAGIAAGVNWASKEIGEKGLAWGNRGRGDPRGHRDTGAGVVAQRGNPANVFNAHAENTALRVGEEYRKSLTSKVEAAEGYYKLGKLAVTHPRQMGSAIKTTASEAIRHPEKIATFGKAVAADVAVSTLMDPTTYIGGGLVTAMATSEQFATRAGERAAAQTAEHVVTNVVEESGSRVAARSADEIAESVAARAASTAAREAAPAGLEAATKATAVRAGREASRSGRLLGTIDESPANLRERITGEPVGRIGQARIDFGERIFPGAQSSVPKTLAKDFVQNSPTMPTQGAVLGYRQAKWRATRAGSMLSAPGKYRTTQRVGQILNDPVKALTDPSVQGWAVQGANWAIKEHPEAAAAVGGAIAASQIIGVANTFKTIKNLVTGGDDGDAAPAASNPSSTAAEVPSASSIQGIGLEQFHLDQAHATRVSRRRPNQQAEITTVSDDTMPTQIGPRNWYGPQGSYQTGRGFQQPKTALPPLEQPSDSVLGV